jgi:hypothetical protein
MRANEQRDVRHGGRERGDPDHVVSLAEGRRYDDRE